MINGTKPKAAVLDKPRARRDAAKVLGVALQTRYRRLLEASGDDETVIATADLAQCMYENIEFVIWALKHLGGMNPPPPEMLRQISPPKVRAANDPPPSSIGGHRFPDGSLDDCAGEPPQLSVVPDVCTCPPLEHGIIGRERHMTSCPKYVP